MSSALKLSLALEGKGLPSPPNFHGRWAKETLISKKKKEKKISTPKYYLMIHFRISSFKPTYLITPFSSPLIILGLTLIPLWWELGDLFDVLIWPINSMAYSQIIITLIWTLPRCLLFKANSCYYSGSKAFPLPDMLEKHLGTSIPWT